MGYTDLMRAAHKASEQGNDDAARELITAARQMERTRITAGGLPRADGPALFEGTTQGDTFGPTIAAATKGPLNAVKTFGARTIAPDRTILQRTGDAGLTALSGLGLGYAGAAGLAGEVLGGSPTRERQLARDLMMAGAVAVPELAGVSSTTRIAGQAGRAAMKEVPAPKDRIESGKRAADDLGITPSLGAGGKIRSQTAATLEKVPIAGDAIAKDAVRFVDEIERAAVTAKSKVGDASGPHSAGTELQEGLLRFIERKKEKSKELYDKVGEVLPPATRVELNNTAEVLEEAKVHFADNPALAQKLGLDQWDAIIDEAQANGISWQAVRQFRTSIGEAKAGRGSEVLQKESKSRLDAIYGALTRDMAATAESTPNARAAWEKANTHHARFSDRVEKALDKTIKADNPERAFEALDRMLRVDSSSADINRVRKIKASLKPSEWNDIAASVVDRIGKPTASQQDSVGAGFSPQRFLTQWNGYSPEAKRILLPGPVRAELQKVADVAATAREANVERNFANTGNIVAGAALGTSAMQAPITTIFAAGAVWGSAKAMTSPVFLRALNNAARGDVKQIKAMAGGKGPFAEDAKTVLRIMSAEASTTSGANQNTNPLRAAQ